MMIFFKIESNFFLFLAALSCYVKEIECNKS